jgi:hypothetical protein
MFRPSRFVLATMIAVSAASAQTLAADPSARLREVLPADVAERVLAVIANARAHELPAAALENRALKFAAHGVPAADIEQSIKAQAARMEHAKDALNNGRGKKASDDEVDAGAEAMRKGVDGAEVSALAKSAPSGRSLAVPLFVIGSLVERGLPSDSALMRVQAKLQAKASDRELEDMPGQSGGHKPALTGQARADAKRPTTVRRPTMTPVRPPSVPANPGKATAPGKAPTKRP